MGRLEVVVAVAQKPPEYDGFDSPCAFDAVRDCWILNLLRGRIESVGCEILVYHGGQRAWDMSVRKSGVLLFSSAFQYYW